jgi:hypothetical protein
MEKVNSISVSFSFLLLFVIYKIFARLILLELKFRHAKKVVEMRPKYSSAENAKIRKPEKGIKTGHRKKTWNFFSNFACHPCAGTMLIFSVLFQFYW